MNENLIADFEAGLIVVGDDILSWRNDAESRKILEPKAFKTEADLKAHSLVKKLIRNFFPSIGVLSEEDKNLPLQRPGSYWLIDPIDGTASWYDGFDGFVTQVAYIENGTPLYGAVYAPALHKLWSGKKGLGAKLNGVSLPKLVPANRLSLIDNYPEPRRAAKRIADSIPVTNYIECGSLGLKSCLVADGTADLFVKDVVIRDWDIAPAAVILGEVDGVICDLNGKEINFEGGFEKNDGLIVARDYDVARQTIDLFAMPS